MGPNMLVQLDLFSEFLGAVRLIRSWGIPVENIARFTDTCSQQFRSRNTNADLRSLKSLLEVKNITWHYFEANEGKNLSDSIGALTTFRNLVIVRFPQSVK